MEPRAGGGRRRRSSQVSLWAKFIYGRDTESDEDAVAARTKTDELTDTADPNAIELSPTKPATTTVDSDNSRTSSYENRESSQARCPNDPDEKREKSRKHASPNRRSSYLSNRRVPHRVVRVASRHQRRSSSISSIFEYLTDLVIGRCVCKHRTDEDVSRITVLHADPLVSVDATQYAPGKEVPVDLEIPSLPSERHTLENIINRCPTDIDLRYRHLSIMSLGEELSSTENIALLHISAHGTITPGGKYALVLENECGFADFCLLSRLQKLLRSCTMPKCVVLSACYSEHAAKVFLDAGASHIVVCRKDQRCLDTSARYFNRFFYMALINGHTVRRAFSIAKANVAAVIDSEVPDYFESKLSPDEKILDGDEKIPAIIDEKVVERSGMTSQGSSRRIPESDKFLLLPEDGNHDVVLFPTPKRTRQIFNLARKPPRAVNHPPVPSYAIGRHVQVSRCVSLLRTHRCVNIVGRRKVGKTTIAAMCIQYVSERCFFADGVYYIDLSFLQNTLNLESKNKKLRNSSHKEKTIEKQTAIVQGFVRALKIRKTPPQLLAARTFKEVFEIMSSWHTLIVLDHCNCQIGAFIASSLLKTTHRPKVLLSSLSPIELGKGGPLRQVVVARELSYASSRELLRVLAPWKTEKAIDDIIRETKGSPGSIRDALEIEIKNRST